MRFFGLLAWLLVVFARPALAEVPPALQPLEQRLAVLATENPGEFGIAALDLETGAVVSFNGDRPFPMASTMKIAVAAAYLSEVDAGRRRLDDPIAGTTATMLLDAMITRSDNRATDLLLAALGGPAVVDGWLRRHRLDGIRVDRTIAQLLGDRRDLRDIRDSSTPTAMLDLLRLIDSGDALTPASRSLLLDMMRRCATGSNRIRDLLPPGVRVEHKTGTLSGYTGDVGFLTLPDGRRIAVVFFARGGSNRPAVISTAARAIYDAFGTRGLAGQLGGRVVQAVSGPAGAAGLPQSGPPSATCMLGGRAVQAQC
ncbi:serine hydrolase [Sphingosinicella sp. LHD-64]|uniref:serine hydrolase n=1 Tax=Sphingosinicella sp. LHD-64 TaxID=3072139 RepID=UPI00280F8FB0|nr:serine hydrolase [Sphingosinicella sp. LHD-64]MDQ8754660.1 serine hydrolase [Sphingosinicella sp. LHD-64]